METSDQLDKLVPALVAARGAMIPAAKTGLNKFDNYNYATEEDWCAAVMPPLVSNGLTLLFSVSDISDAAERRTKAGGVEYSRSVRGAARLLHESGQWIEVACVGEGQDRGDKAVYKAITGMKKYGYATLLALPTSDDPEKHADKDEHDGVPTPKGNGNTPKTTTSMPNLEKLRAKLATLSIPQDIWTYYCACKEAFVSAEAREVLRTEFSPAMRDKVLVACAEAKTTDDLNPPAKFLETAKNTMLEGDLTAAKAVLHARADVLGAQAPKEPATA